MKVRFKKNNAELTSNRFNTNALAEVIAYGEEGDCDSFFTRDLEVYLESKKEWKDMNLAFMDKDLITDDYNTEFFEPKNDLDRARGYAL